MLRAFLGRRGVGEAAVDHAVRELASAGYLDDASYARRYAEDRRTLDGWGRERIGRSLERRGVATEHVTAALAPVDRDDELEAALGLLARRWPQPPESDRDRARAWRLLVTRGYASELAYEAVRRHEAKGV